MKFVYRILLYILPLILLPLLLGAALPLIRGSRLIREQVIRNANLELEFFLKRCEEEHQLLKGLGIADTDFYRENAQNAVIQFAQKRAIPGGFLFIQDEAKTPQPGTDEDIQWYTTTTAFAPWDWVIGVAIDRTTLFSFQRDMLLFTSLLLLALIFPTLFSALRISRKMAKPLEKLEERAAKLAEGDMTARAEITGDQEIASLARTFNLMAANIENLTHNLEEKVEKRTRALEKTLADLQTTQEQLIQSEKLSALGQLTAGIAHELNSPLGAILSVSRGMQATIQHNLREQKDFNLTASAEEQALLYDVLKSSSEALPRPDSLIDRTQRRAAADQLPLESLDDPESCIDAVLTLQLLDRSELLDRILRTPEPERLLLRCAALMEPAAISHLIIESAEKASRVVEALRNYIEAGSEDRKEAIDINRELDDVLILFHSKLKNGIKLKRDYSPEARLFGNRHQLNIVWTNLIKNALESMEYRGILKVRTTAPGKALRVDIIDNGPGIPEKDSQKIFAPFFTTKAHGAGIGLGLDISQRIVENYGGTISWESRPGHTVFSVTLPAGREADE